MNDSRALVSEIYSGIQGEGILVGERQIFLRFLRCNIHCDYCDTEYDLPPTSRARVERTPGIRDFEEVANPVSVPQAAAFLERLQKFRGLHRWVSLTGGEPLVHVRFIEELIGPARSLGLSLFLETNGTLPEALERVAGDIDMVSMDIKESADGADWESTVRFLELASRRPAYVKMVVRRGADPEWFVRAARTVAAVDPGMTLVLQPVTPHGPVEAGPEPGEVLAIQEAAKRVLAGVRVIPQTHKLIDQL